MSFKAARLDRIEKLLSKAMPSGPRCCFVLPTKCESMEEWLDVYAPRSGESDDERRKRYKQRPMRRVFFDGEEAEKNARSPEDRNWLTH